MNMPNEFSVNDGYPAHRLSGVAVAVLAGVLCMRNAVVAAPSVDAAPPLGRIMPEMINDRVVRSVQMGTRYLVKTQRGNGSWLSDGGYGSYPVVMTSLGGIALMAGGSTPESGPYSRNVSHALNYVLNVAESGVQEDDKKVLITAGSSGGGMRSMYGHGFGMLFLAQCYGMEKNRQRAARIKRVLEGAVNLTASAQSDLGAASEHAGGWTYTPQSKSDEGSVTVTQLQALRACRNAGIAVPVATIERTVAYLRLMQQPDGGICYSSRSRGNSQPAISAAAIACFYAAGIYDRGTAESRAEAKMVDRLVAYCRRIGPGDGGGHYFYTHFYKAQGLYQRGGDEWEAYFPRLRDRLISMQMPDGNWNGDHVGPIYGTSIALVILQLPYGRLPVCQRHR